MDEREYHDDFYERDAARIFDAPLFSEVLRRMTALLAQHGRTSPRDRVLSLGCGDGRKECLMAPLVKEIIGIELSPVAVEQARARAVGAGYTNVRFEIGDIQGLAVAPETFDAVWALGIIHHLSDVGVENLLQRSYAALRPGGILVSIDPSAHRLIGLFKALFARAYQTYHSPGEQEVAPGKLREFCCKAGFAPVIVRYNDFLLGPLAWLFPQCPRSLAPAIIALESILLAIPGLCRTASSFCIVARKPGGGAGASPPRRRYRTGRADVTTAL
jgi:SAM-dependent methyltransferase